MACVPMAPHTVPTATRGTVQRPTNPAGATRLAIAVTDELDDARRDSHTDALTQSIVHQVHPFAVQVVPSGAARKAGIITRLPRGAGR